MGLGNSSQMFSLTFIQNVNIIIAIFHAGQRTKIFRKIFVSSFRYTLLSKEIFSDMI